MPVPGPYPFGQNFSRGDLCPTVWLPLTAATVYLNVRDDNVDVEAALFDVTNTGSNGLTARLGGKLDASGTVNADFDMDLPPYLPPYYVLPAVRGIYGKTLSGGGGVGVPLNPARVIQVPTIVAKVHFQSAVDSEVKYSFDVKMDARAGFLIWPSI